MASGQGDTLNFDSPVNLKTLDEVATWAYDQFKNLERVLNEGHKYVILVPIDTEPPKPRAGMLIYASVSTMASWDPGSGEGPYVYDSSGTWIFLG